MAKFQAHPLSAKFPPFAGYREVESRSFYGEGYQDMSHRRPSIRNARKLLNWAPRIGLERSVEETLDFFLKEAIRSDAFEIKDAASDA